MNKRKSKKTLKRNHLKENTQHLHAKMLAVRRKKLGAQKTLFLFVRKTFIPKNGSVLMTFSDRNEVFSMIVRFGLFGETSITHALLNKK